jgi:hypothetical protein
MKLYSLKRGSKIYEEVDDTNLIHHKGSYIIFHRLDGAYSFCMAHKKDGEEIGSIHLSASTPLVKYKDGYKIGEKVESQQRAE